MEIIRIELVATGFLGSKKSAKHGTEIIIKEYICPITVRKLLIDARIKVDFLGLIILNGKSIHQDFLIETSCRIKLFPILGGG